MQINRCGKGGGSAAGSRRRGAADRVLLKVDDRDMVLIVLSLFVLDRNVDTMLLLMEKRLLLVLLVLMLRVVGVTTTRGFFSVRGSTSLVSGELVGL